MGKSQAHASALHAHLTGNGQHSTHSVVPSNPQKAIASSTKDETLIGVDHRRDPDAEAERAGMKRKAVLEANSVPRTIGKNAGAFDKLLAGLRQYVRENGGAEQMAKAVSTEDSLNQAELMRQLKAGRKAAPKGSMLKSLTPAFDKVAKDLGVANPLRKSLTAGYGTSMPDLSGGSALREQSISAKKKPKPLSPEDLLKAASTLMHHGRLDPQTAQKFRPASTSPTP